MTDQEAIAEICALVAPHTPRELCTTVEAVAWLVERHKAAHEALLQLEEIRTDKLAAMNLHVYSTAISAARVALYRSQND